MRARRGDAATAHGCHRERPYAASQTEQAIQLGDLIGLDPRFSVEDAAHWKCGHRVCGVAALGRREVLGCLLIRMMMLNRSAIRLDVVTSRAVGLLGTS